MIYKNIINQCNIIFNYDIEMKCHMISILKNRCEEYI